MLRWPTQPAFPQTAAERIRQAEQIAARLSATWSLTAGSGLFPPNHGQKTPRDDREFWQLRPYHPGDPIRGIDWRKSARGDDLLIRERERHDPYALTLWIDPAPGMKFRSAPHLPTKAQTAHLTALVLTRLLLHSETEVRLATQSGPQKTTDLPQIDALIAEGKAPALTNLPPLIPKQGALWLLSDFWTPWDELEKNLDALRAPGRKLHLFHITDPAERDLRAWRGRVRFKPLEGSTHEQIESVADIRSAYQSRIAEHEKNLKDWCRRTASAFTPLQTDTPIAQSLGKKHD